MLLTLPSVTSASSRNLVQPACFNEDVINVGKQTQVLLSLNQVTTVNIENEAHDMHIKNQNMPFSIDCHPHYPFLVIRGTTCWTSSFSIILRCHIHYVMPTPNAYLPGKKNS